MQLDEIGKRIFLAPGASTLSFFKVPALFFSNGTAFNPGLTNLMSAGGRLYAPRQFGPAAGTQRDIFEEVIKNTVPEVLRFVDDWDLYHRAGGEVHCGTAEKRALPVNLPKNAWWNKLP